MHSSLSVKDHQEFMMRQFIENELVIMSRVMTLQNDGSKSADIECTGPDMLTAATRTFQKQTKAHKKRYRDPTPKESRASTTAK